MYYFYFIYVIQKCWFETLLYFKTVFHNLKFNYTTIYKMILLPWACLWTFTRYSSWFLIFIFLSKISFSKTVLCSFRNSKISIFNLFSILDFAEWSSSSIFQRPAECRSRLFGSLPTAHAQKVKGEKLYSVHNLINLLNCATQTSARLPPCCYSDRLPFPAACAYLTRFFSQSSTTYFDHFHVTPINHNTDNCQRLVII